MLLLSRSLRRICIGRFCKPQWSECQRNPNLGYFAYQGLRAPMSFFVKTETGFLVNRYVVLWYERVTLILCRFSQDMRLVDMTLPSVLVNVSFRLFPIPTYNTENWYEPPDLASCVGITCLVSTAVGFFAASVPFILCVLVAVQRYYLRTSRQLRLLEWVLSTLFKQY